MKIPGKCLSMNKNLVIISALFLLFASGCTYPPVRNQLYSGKPLPAQHISVIYPAKTKFFQPKAIIHFVDGKKIIRANDGGARIEVLPGHHVVSVGFVEAPFGVGSFSDRDQNISLDAKAGHRYEVRIGEWNQNTLHWKAEIIDTR